MNISKMTFAGALGFAIASSTCGTPIADAASCVVGLSFTPQSISASGTTINGTLTIADDVVSSPQKFVNLIGTGTAPVSNAIASYAPTPVTFAAAMGYSAQQNLTVTNTSSNPLYMSSLTLSDPSDFGIVNNGCPVTPNSLAASGSCTIALDFAPQSNETVAGSLMIADNTSSSPETVALSGATLTCPIGQPKGPTPPIVTPRLFFSGGDTQLTVTSVVPPDPNLIASNVTLLQVDSNGNNPVVLGQMYDDGTHGDAVAGDGQYTAQPTVNISSAGRIYLAVRTNYSGPPGCRQSNNNERPIDVTPPQSQFNRAQFDAENNALTAGEKFLQDDIAGGKSTAQAAQDLVNYMKANFPGVVSDAAVAGTLNDPTGVSVTFTSGRTGGFLLD